MVWGVRGTVKSWWRGKGDRCGRFWQLECEIKRQKNSKITPATLTPEFLRLASKLNSTHSWFRHFPHPLSSWNGIFFLHHTMWGDLLTSLHAIPPYALGWDIRPHIRLPPIEQEIFLMHIQHTWHRAWGSRQNPLFKHGWVCPPYFPILCLFLFPSISLNIDARLRAAASDCLNNSTVKRWMRTLRSSKRWGSES